MSEVHLPEEVHQLDQGVIDEHRDWVLDDVGSEVKHFVFVQL